MRREDIEAEFRREPFRPLRLHLADGKKLDVQFSHAAVFQKSRMIVFKGVKKPTSHVATGFEIVGFDQVDRIDQLPGRGGRRRKKAS